MIMIIKNYGHLIVKVKVKRAIINALFKMMEI